MRPSLTDHYDALSDRFDELWTYEPGYVEALTTQLAAEASIVPLDQVVDVGSGTGLFARALTHHVGLDRMVCVDPSADSLAQLQDVAAIETRQAGAVEMAESPERWDVIIAKEIAHHLDEPARTFAALAARLRPGGRLVILLHPDQVEIPLFDAAMSRYRSLQPSVASLAQPLEDQGFEVDTTLFRYPLSFPVETWLDMIRHRYMSVLSTFDDQELEAGVSELAHRFAGADSVDFEDRFAILVARSAS